MEQKPGQLRILDPDGPLVQTRSLLSFVSAALGSDHPGPRCVRSPAGQVDGAKCDLFVNG